ncbi:sensor histidine kinase, partial [Thermodesulfobacteriota bacterium]
DAFAYYEFNNKMRSLSAEMEAEEKEPLLRDLVSVTMHELKNQLVIAGINCDSALRNYEDQSMERVQTCLQRISTGITNMYTVINSWRQILSAADERKNVDCSQLVDATIQYLKPLSMFDHIDFRCTTAENLPDAHINPFQISQVLLNLYLNAAEAMQLEGAITTAISFDDTSGCIMVSIEDTGAGIPEEFQNEIFEAGYTTKDTGTGMGLYICQQIIQENGGSLETVTKQDSGAVFMLSIPLAEAKASG